MPEVKCIHNLCLDKPIYEISNRTLFGCKVSPNTITSINLFIFTPLILHNIIYDKNYLMLFGLVLVRIYLDILDGNIARKCNLKSKFGSFFDLFGDVILYLVLNLFVFYNIYKYGHKNYHLSAIISILLLYQFYNLSSQIYEEIYLLKNKKKENRFMNEFNTILADNSIFFAFTGIFFIKFFIKYLKKK